MTEIKQKPEEYQYTPKPVVTVDVEHQQVNAQLEELRERALHAEKERSIYANHYSYICHCLERFLGSIIKENFSIYFKDEKIYITGYKFDNTVTIEETLLSEYLASIVVSIQLKNSASLKNEEINTTSGNVAPTCPWKCNYYSAGIEERVLKAESLIRGINERMLDPTDFEKG